MASEVRAGSELAAVVVAALDEAAALAVTTMATEEAVLWEAVALTD